MRGQRGSWQEGAKSKVHQNDKNHAWTIGLQQSVGDNCAMHVHGGKGPGATCSGQPPHCGMRVVPYAPVGRVQYLCKARTRRNRFWRWCEVQPSWLRHLSYQRHFKVHHTHLSLCWRPYECARGSVGAARKPASARRKRVSCGSGISGVRVVFVQYTHGKGSVLDSLRGPGQGFRVEAISRSMTP